MPYLTAPEDLGALLPGEPGYRATQLRQWLYDHPVLTADEMTNLPGSIRKRLADRLWPFRVEARQSADGGSTVKFLYRSPDGVAIESVLMGYSNRTTLCISSQAGCAMACTFCATGKFGFERHLQAGEIVAQLAHANAVMRRDPLPGSPRRVGNVVFMGMGEPLANYANLREAIRRLIEVVGMSARSITVSTVGFVPGMLRLAEEPWPVTLAVSLHAGTDQLRQELVPLNRRYPLETIIDAAGRFSAKRGRRVTLEWTLMADVNDTAEQARLLAEMARGLRAHVNIIPFNPIPLAPYRRPGPDGIERFAAQVSGHGANVTVRDTRGEEIDAACGQLRARSEPGTDRRETEDGRLRTATSRDP